MSTSKFYVTYEDPKDLQVTTVPFYLGDEKTAEEKATYLRDRKLSGVRVREVSGAELEAAEIARKRRKSFYARMR